MDLDYSSHGYAEPAVMLNYDSTTLIEFSPVPAEISKAIQGAIVKGLPAPKPYVEKIAVQLKTPIIPEYVQPLDWWSESALRVLNERYLSTYPNGVRETPEGMLYRVARAAAEAEVMWMPFEKQYSTTILNAAAENLVADQTKIFYTLMAENKFLPNSPTLMNAGTGNGLQLSACFTAAIEDNIEGIYDTLKSAAIIAKSGGGIGHCFSTLRPANSKVNTTQGVSSGPVSFLKLYDASTAAIKQGGTRRGANMATFDVSHPDLMDFIHCKLFKPDGTRDITNFNVSVLATDDFMEAVKNDSDWNLINKWDKDKVVATYKAREIFDEIARCAWETGDPGLLFVDKANNSSSNPIPSLETLDTTNPCGEIWLGSYDACNLGSINLGKFVEDDTSIDYYSMGRAVHTAIHLLDNIIEINPFPLQKITDKVKSLRRLGLGVMGWADMLFKVRTPYNSNDALKLAEDIMSLINANAVDESRYLAVQRGPFPLFGQSIYANDKVPRRNAQVTAIAPTGTISILDNCSSGIEPVFALAYQHKVKQVDGERVLNIVNDTFKSIMVEEGYYSVDLENYVSINGTFAGYSDYVAKSQPSLYPNIPADLEDAFIIAQEVSPEWHIKMQAAWQQWTENSISKTVNLPNNATIQDVKDSYIMAYDLGCKGITVFRDGCLSTGQVLNVGTKKEEVKQESVAAQKVEEEEFLRPRILHGYTRQVVAPEGTVHVTLNSDEVGDLREVFVNVGRSGSDISALSEALGRLISLILQMDASVANADKLYLIQSQLNGIGGSSSVGFGPNRVASLADAVSRVIREHPLNIGPNLVSHQDPTVPNVVAQSIKKSVKVGNACPSCGNIGSFIREEGCKKCYNCGYSEC